ncbi:cupredoxin domain-containing protein [Rhabdothermincola salaria]|uniref:cupredoxin domain-containing protein n=1 Tax=Rhabdothermincola salaria TaxID=2903142 RepID=UPI001E2A313F|nr:plastocyanin/azurin family copper-binding protein [Rhabdothermincola salaria]MCD9624512.1 plastocyanin/azurin family copper-binding protein [Rhabdothermincola salaria]
MTPLLKRSMAATFLVAAIGLGGCASDDATSTDATTGDDSATTVAEVTIDTFIFSPDPLEVEAGTTVTFENLDDTTHTVTAGTRDEPADDFDHDLAQGESVDVTFDEPGTHPYFCAIHSGEGMTGEIVVQ